MRKILLKFSSVLAIFAMTFAGTLNVALADPQDNNGGEHTPMTICHMTGNGGYHTITIDDDAWPAHQQHGDYEGPCQGGDNDGCEQNDLHTAVSQEDGGDDEGDCNNNDDDCNVTAPTFVNNSQEGEDDDENEGDDCQNGGGDEGNDPTGSITVCKVIVNSENQIVDGGELPTATFTIPWLNKPENLGESWTEATKPENAVFMSPLDLNTAVINEYKGNSGDCITYEDLPLGNYYYGEEQISGSDTSSWQTPKYNDQNVTNVGSVNDFFAYDNALFTVGDVERNTDSDGHIVLNSDIPNRTLVVLNKYEDTCEPVRGLPVYARIKFSKISDGAAMNGWRNWGASADMAPKVFVGGNNPLPHGSGGNVYNDEEWFMIYDGLNYLNDADISGYEDVPGIAVERMNGKIRVVLDGHHTLLNAEFGAKELAAGVVQFSNDASTISSDALPVSFKSPVNWGPGNVNDGWSNDNMNPRIHDAVVNDAANPMDARGSFVGYIDQYNERFDRARTNGNKVEFHLVATTGSDGFYVQYNHTPGKPCNPVEVCTPVPGLPVYARIKLSAQPYGWRNWGTGNMAPKIYVGGNTPSDVYNSGEWFMVYDGLNYINDADISSYEDVDGLAVQRVNGGLRVVLHGSLAEPTNNLLMNRELAQGSIEFSNDMITRSTDAVPTSQVSDPANAMDMNGESQYLPGGDTMSIVNNLSQFHMLTTVNDDGFYAYYNHTLGTPCNQEVTPQ